MRYIVLNVFNGREHKVFESRDREKAIDRAERLHRALKQDYKVFDRVTRSVEYESREQEIKITYTGKEEEIFKILNCLSSNSSSGDMVAVMSGKGSLTIPTSLGARQIFKGDTVIIDGDFVRVEEI